MNDNRIPVDKMSDKFNDNMNIKNERRQGC